MLATARKGEHAIIFGRSQYHIVSSLSSCFFEAIGQGLERIRPFPFQVSGRLLSGLTGWALWEYEFKHWRYSKRRVWKGFLPSSVIIKSCIMILCWTRSRDIENNVIDKYSRIRMFKHFYSTKQWHHFVITCEMECDATTQVILDKSTSFLLLVAMPFVTSSFLLLVFNDRSY